MKHGDNIHLVAYVSAEYVKFAGLAERQMSDEKLQMYSKAKNAFAYTVSARQRSTFITVSAIRWFWHFWQFIFIFFFHSVQLSTTTWEN